MLLQILVRGWDRVVHVLALAAYRLPYARPERHGVELFRDVAYRDTGKHWHLLDVYRPKHGASRGTVMYVHGGGFAVLSKDTHRVMALAFATQGYTVFNVNYRLGPAHRYPAAIEDVSKALLWIVAHARDYGASAERLVLAGESAGANLVTALGYIATHPRPESFAREVYDRAPSLGAVMPIYGLLDLHDLERFDHPRLSVLLKTGIHRAAAAYVGRPVRENAPRCPLASPLRLLAEPPPPGARPLPPFFAACGTADPLLVDSKRLAAVLEARGGTCDLSIHPKEIHGFNAMIWRRAARQKWRAAFGFLARHVPQEAGT